MFWQIFLQKSDISLFLENNLNLKEFYFSALMKTNTISVYVCAR